MNNSAQNRDGNVLKEPSSGPSKDLDWEREKTKPTTRNERATRGADMFEWSLEQKAILSPANITTDTDGTDDWQNVADLNPSWRQQESDVFFSQRTIAPSPLITPPARVISSNLFQDLLHGDDEEGQNLDERDEDNDREAQDLSINHNNQSAKTMSYEFEDDHRFSPNRSEDGRIDDDCDDATDIDETNYNDESKNEDQEEMMDNLFFSPQPLKSSQTQQRMDIFSPDTFDRVMEDENTLQSTPKTTGLLQRIRNRTRMDVLD